MNPQRILVCGHRAFAAKGLPELLRSAGHTVSTFSRGPVGQDGDAITGPVDQMHENPHLDQPFDTVINYILLKDDPIDKNNAFITSLVECCKRRNVKHLVHLSSVSVYSGDIDRIVEEAQVETVPDRKGSYGSLKVATDIHLSRIAPAELRLSMVRPGFILGLGLMDPIIGMAMRFLNNRLLVLGDAKNQLPVVTREQVNEAILKIVDLLDPNPREAFLILDNHSPLREQWLKGVCEQLGAGVGLIKLPPWFWLMAGYCSAPLVKLAGMKMKPIQMMKNITRRQRYDSTITQRRLGMDMRVDWPKEVRNSFTGQDWNFKLPYQPIHPAGLRLADICYIGFGQVVKSQHLPSLKRAGFRGQLHALDMVSGIDAATGVNVQPLENATLPKADLVIVASPGPVHNRALPLLRQTDAAVLIEKPLCYTEPELAEWIDFTKGRTAPVYVCQNFRYKSNVQKMIAHLAKFNPGKLLSVDILFQSPSIAKEWRTWTRNERKARTLLMDYSVHYLDLACMFATDGWKLDHSRYELDGTDFTSLIEGRFSSPAYSVNFKLRQGFIPRVARLVYTFQNYMTTLTFFPDTFTAQMADDGSSLHKATAKAQGKATRTKIIDKLTKRYSDISHATAFEAAGNQTQAAEGMTVRSLESYYRALFQLATSVYGQ